jgi:hypothetical protein
MLNIAQDLHLVLTLLVMLLVNSITPQAVAQTISSPKLFFAYILLSE